MSEFIDWSDPNGGVNWNAQIEPGDCDDTVLDETDNLPATKLIGFKKDHGKPMAGLLTDFSRALLAVSEVGTFGAQKYSRSNWLLVENGEERYNDAMWRHLLEANISERDEESGCLHKVHAVWNALAELELMLISQDDDLAGGKEVTL